MSPWDPFGDFRSEVKRLEREMNRMFGRFGRGDGLFRSAAQYPALNLWEDEDTFYLEAELPGMEMNDLEIMVSGGNQLSIKGERKQPELSEEAASHRQECAYGSFQRLFELPVDVDPDKVEAQLKHGVLSVKLPKHEQAKSRKIAVKAE